MKRNDRDARFPSGWWILPGLLMYALIITLLVQWWR